MNKMFVPFLPWQDQGKNKEGNCQREFICQYPSHQKYPVKKHVLICEKHKNSEDNQAYF